MKRNLLAFLALAVALTSVPLSASANAPISDAGDVLARGDVLDLLEKHGVDTSGKSLETDEGDQLLQRNVQATPSGGDQTDIIADVNYTARVAVPKTADGQLEVVSDAGVVAVSLPEPGSAKREVLSDRVSAFSHGDGSVSVPISRDNGFQVVTMISSADAPETYSYKLDLNGGRGELVDGHVLIFGADDQFLGGFDAPWAKDDAGVNVPTQYSLSDDVLTQIIEHRNREDISYPVVADPNYTSGVFTKSTVSAYSASNPGYKVSAWLSAAGRAYSIAQPAQFNVTGWTVLRTHHPGYMLQGGVERPNMRQQWNCHVIGGFAEWSSWDLETGRPSNPNWLSRIGTVWPPALICNW